MKEKTIYESELTGKTYESKEECLEAEKQHEIQIKGKEEKGKRAKEIKDAYEHYLKVTEEGRKKSIDAYNTYVDLKNKFVKDYGSFHMTVTNEENQLPDVNVEPLFKSMIDFIDSNLNDWLFF